MTSSDFLDKALGPAVGVVLGFALGFLANYFQHRLAFRRDRWKREMELRDEAVDEIKGLFKDSPYEVRAKALDFFRKASGPLAERVCEAFDSDERLKDRDQELLQRMKPFLESLARIDHLRESEESKVRDMLASLREIPEDQRGPATRDAILRLERALNETGAR